MLEWAKSNPLWIAGGIFFVGLLFLLSRGGGGSGDGGMSAFYAAQNASKTSGDQVMIAQIQANAQSQLGLAYLDTQKAVNTTWAATQLSQSQINANTAVQLAPYGVQAAYLGAITEIASMPVQTVTTTTKKKKLFGSSSSSSTTVVPNPGWDLLDNFDDMFNFPALPGG